MNPPNEPPDSTTKRSWLRRLYEWVLHWADTAYGVPALGVVSFTESSFFPIPPDPLLMALTLGRPRRWLWFATVCTATSVLGGLFGYWIGHEALDKIGRPMLELNGAWDNFVVWKERFQSYGFWAVLGAALTPIPYKIFTIAAGAGDLALPTFIVASFIGRGVRFFVVALLIGLFGEPIRGFIDRYFNLLCLAFFALLVLGFVVIKVLA